ncbi:calcium and integrin-binding protein 1 [Cephus cinctus]|uniref:Calcium and integrin-binding protein 1 n=1 Tax=Cephus cinctus TaxID=211228 RepID=A0AAJ7FFG0_CEPCN|nr:calcium and integrin-binding protein 1 [Cephus cinctus]
MGNSKSVRVGITQEMLEEYTQLTYLTKAEIHHIFKLFKTLGTEELSKDIYHRFPVDDILKILPQIRHNPFRESVLRVFSSEQDSCMSFDDVLDLCSALSDNCPEYVRAAWAFQIFDFDGDNQVSLDDLIEAVERLTGFNENGQIRIDRQSAEHIAQMVLEEMDLDHTGSIGPQEFVHTVARMPEFAQTFQLMP